MSAYTQHIADRLQLGRAVKRAYFGHSFLGESNTIMVTIIQNLAR
jgi:hypothetical protein